MNDRRTLSLPQGRTKHRFDVRGRDKDKPKKPFVPRGHQATLDANVGKEVTICGIGGNVCTAKLLASDAYTVTLDEPSTGSEVVVFKHAIATIHLQKAVVAAEPVSPNV